MPYTYLRRAVVLVIAVLLSLLAGGYLALGLDHALAAQRPISPEDETWIQTAVARADVDSEADRVELAGCLRARISTGTGRFDAVAGCYARFQEARATPGELAARLIPDLAREAAEAFGAPALSYQEFVVERQRLIDERTVQLLEAVRLWGATPEQLTTLRGPLTACMAAWGTIPTPEIIRNAAGGLAYRLSEEIVDWCADDLPDFGSLRRTQPTLRALGCPNPVIQDRPFICAPEIEGDATRFDWAVSGGTSASGRSASLTTGTTGTATISLLICNGEPEPGTAGNCTELTWSVTVEPRAPVVGSPGCPASVARGQAVTCTPTGVSNTTGTTSWGWTATGAQLASDGLPALTVTFTTGGGQTVTVIACASAQSCSAPVSQTVTVTGALASATIRLNKTSYQANEAIQYCFTVPAPGPVRFTMTFPTGQARVLNEGVDDGRGDCLTDRVSLPQGQSPTSGCIRMELTSLAGSASPEVCFEVRNTSQPSPSPTAGMSGTCSRGWAGRWYHLRNVLPVWPDLVLTVSGTTVTGSFGSGTSVSGTITGDTLRARAGTFALEIRLGWGADAGGRLTRFSSCNQIAVKVDNGLWNEFQLR